MQLHENSPECAVNFDYDSVDSGDGNEALTYSHGDLLEFGRKLVRYVQSKDRARLTLDCLDLALGDSESNMTVIAEKHGLTKAAISKRTKEIREQLHLGVNANNKSKSAVQKYRNNRSPLRLGS